MCRDPWRINFLGYFGLFYEIPLFSYAFNHELIVFDGPIDAPMLNCYEINELLCWMWTLEIMLQTLKDNKLYAKLSKCEFWLEEVSFLRHVISKGRIVVDPSKVKALMSWKSPKSV